MPHSREADRSTDQQRLRCLVVDADEAKRSFLAEAWAFFRPGFEVFTAPDADSAIAWLQPARPHIVAVGASLDPGSVRAVLTALDEISTERRYVVIVEARSDLYACLRVDSSVPLLELSAPLSLEAVLSIGRAAASIVRGEEADADVVILPVTLRLPDAEMSG